MRSRSTGVLPLNTAAMSSATISGSLISVDMGAAPMFAQAPIAVNRPVEAPPAFCYHEGALGMWAVSSLAPFSVLPENPI
jgi:hypothetical protein